MRCCNNVKGQRANDTYVPSHNNSEGCERDKVGTMQKGMVAAMQMIKVTILVKKEV